MNSTRTLEREEMAPPPDVSAQTAAILVALASQARALHRPTLLFAMVACTAATSAWLSSYAKYTFDSATSFTLCAVILGTLQLPAVFLLWVYRSLVEITKLPAKFHLPSQEIPTNSSVFAIDEGGSLLQRWRRRLVRRVDASLKVWSSLQYFSGISSIGRPRLFLWFLAMPVSEIVVGTVLLVSALLVLVAILQIARLIIASVL